MASCVLARWVLRAARSERERESTLLLPSLPVPVFHLALLLVFLQSLVLPVNRGFWRSPTPSPGPGEQPHDRADLLLQPKPLSAKRQPEPLLPGAMGPVWVGKGTCVSQQGRNRWASSPHWKNFSHCQIFWRIRPSLILLIHK